MAGCFGNSKEDQFRERELDRYLGTFRPAVGTCDKCGAQRLEDQLFRCPDCGADLCRDCAVETIDGRCRLCFLKACMSEGLHIGTDKLSAPDKESKKGWVVSKNLLEKVKGYSVYKDISLEEVEDVILCLCRAQEE